MRYTYLDIIAENDSTYLKVRFGLFCFLLFLIAVIYIMIKNNNKSINEFPSRKIVVNEIQIDYLLKKPSATFNFKKFVKIEALKITTDDSKFYINKNMKEFWPLILKKVKVGDEIIIHYQIIQDNMELVYLETDSEVIFSWNSLWHKDKLTDLFFYGIFLTSISVLASLMFKRRKLGKKV
jgi:hypothetical protein